MTPRLASSAPFTLIRIDAASGRPLYQQICEGIRRAILEGRLAPGAQLPAARVLAQELGVSRQRVVLAIEQLRAEGYLESRERSSVFISPALPEDLLHPRASAKSKLAATTRVENTVDAPARAAKPFRIGLPAIDVFPWELWARLLSRHVRRAGPTLADYDHPAGYALLRREIVDYVSAARGVVCNPDQVVVTCGAQQALYLLARTLIKPGAEMWIENPGYPGARQAFTDAGAKLVPVPIDEQGISVTDGIEYAADARLAYVTPSHQYPLGITMSAARRLELLAWARRARAWVIEDDYNSEFRYASRPLASLQGLDGGEHVIYVGTFSKTLFPALRLGYLVLPPPLVEAVLAQRYVMDRHAPTIEQAVLAEFLADGHFARHVRRMRALYEDRRNALLRSLERTAGGVIQPGPADAGMHIVGWLADDVVDTTASVLAEEAGIVTTPLSQYCLQPATGLGCRPGLLFGFTGFRPPAIASAVERLVSALKHAPRSQGHANIRSRPKSKTSR